MSRRNTNAYRHAAASNLDTLIYRRLRAWRDDLPVVRAADLAASLGWPSRQVHESLERLKVAGSAVCVQAGGAASGWRVGD